MSASRDPSPAKSSPVESGPPNLHYNVAHRLAIWQPHGVIDERLLDQVTAWIFAAEKQSRLPFNRFVDLTHATKLSLPTGYLFKLARERVENFKGLAPIRSAFFCDHPVGFGIARLYETLIADSSIEGRAFRDRTAAAEWLGVPVEALRIENASA